MKIVWSPRAVRNLAAIGRYIAADKPAAARRWVEQLQARARTIPQAPLAGRLVPELEHPQVREVFLRSYRIVYRVGDPNIQILAVFDGHQLFPEDLPIPSED